MSHGTNRSMIVGSVFRLRRFTLPDLCNDTRLGRKQAYPILASLEKEGYVQVQSLRGQEAKRHRPLNLYTLVEDPALRAKLMKEFEPSLKMAQALAGAPEPEALVRARSSLNTIGPELAELAGNPESLAPTRQSSLKLHDFQQQIDSVSQDLETALYRLAPGENEELPPAMQAEFERLRKAREHVAKLNGHLNKVLETKLETQKETANTFREAIALGIAMLGKAAVEAISPARLSSYYAKGQEPVWFDSAFKTAARSVRQLEHNPSSDLAALQSNLTRLFEQKYERAPTLELRQVLAAVKTNVATAFRGCENAPSPGLSVLWTLAESAIRYAADPDTAFWACKSIEGQLPVDPLIASYNSMNLCFLAGNTREARDWWKSLAENDNFLRRPARTTYPVLLVATASAEELRRDVLDKMRDVLGSSFACSIVAAERIEAISQNPFVVEPSAYNLLAAGESVPMSDGLKILTKKLYVYGPLENVLKRPGVPVITLATGLAGLGLPSEDAWEIADNLRAGTALFVVNSSQEVQANLPAQLDHFVDVLAPQQRITLRDESSGSTSVQEDGSVVYAEKPVGSGMRAVAARAGYSHFYSTADK
jgi:hypothetical protein